MAQTARVNVPRNILDWVMSIGAEDHLSESQRQNIDDTPPVYAKRTIGSQQPQGHPSRDLVDTIDQTTASIMKAPD